MQPRARHLLGALGLDLHDVPASNVVFVRTINERDLEPERDAVLGACWPVHDTVISALRVDTVVCFGGTSGRWVRRQAQADRLVGSMREQNARDWECTAHANASDTHVVTLTHHSRAAWQRPEADPTPLVAAGLRRA